MKLIDTDILIDHIYSHAAARNFLRSLMEAGEQPAVSVVTIAELFTRNVKHYPMGDITVTAPYARGW